MKINKWMQLLIKLIIKQHIELNQVTFEYITLTTYILTAIYYKITKNCKDIKNFTSQVFYWQLCAGVLIKLMQTIELSEYIDSQEGIGF